MAKISHTPISWTINHAILEFGVTGNKVRSGLKAQGAQPSKDGTFSTREIFKALADSSGLKSKAAEARYQEQIDKAQVTRDKVLENKGELIKKSDLMEFLLDATTVLFQIVRHSKLSEQEKALMNRQITELKVERK
jgi:hypothetical protein